MILSAFENRLSSAQLSLIHHNDILNIKILLNFKFKKKFISNCWKQQHFEATELEYNHLLIGPNADCTQILN